MARAPDALSVFIGVLGVARFVRHLLRGNVRQTLVVGWLAVVNTAFAFTLWNHTLQTLTAVESSVVNNTMTIQIAVLAVLFLGERLDAVQLVGLLLAASGAALVQVAPFLRRRSRGKN